MTSRIARLVFGPLPARAGGFGEACLDDVPATSRFSGTHSPGYLRQKLLSDEELAALLKSGNADALAVLFERHSARLHGIAHKILRNESEAEDVVQQIFLDVFRSVRQFDVDKGCFRTWLFMFGYQRIFNRRRSLAASRFFDSDSFEEFLPGLPRAPEPLPSFSLAEATILIEQVLRSIELRQRRTIELVYGEGLTAEEISARTGETVRVVRHNLYRGLEKLREAAGRIPRSGTGDPMSKGKDR